MCDPQPCKGLLQGRGAKEVSRSVELKMGGCVIRFDRIYTRGHQGQMYVMPLHQDQYIVKLFAQDLNIFYVCTMYMFIHLI